MKILTNKNPKYFKTERCARDTRHRNHLHILDVAPILDCLEFSQNGEAFVSSFRPGENHVDIRAQKLLQAILSNAEVPIGHVKRILPLLLIVINIEHLRRTDTPNQLLHVRQIGLNYRADGGTLRPPIILFH